MSAPKYRHIWPFFSLVVSGLAAVGAAGEAGSRSLAISEVVFLPATPDAPVQIELRNIGATAVDASGWSVCDKDAYRFVIPPLPPVPPGAFIVIEFGPAVEERDDLTFDDNVARLRCRADWSAKAFRGTLNECALYSGSGRKTKDLVDFVRWGRPRPPDRSPSTVGYDQAVARRVWQRGDGVFVSDPAPGDPPAVRPGGGIARRQFATQYSPERDWFVTAPADVSIGAPPPWPIPRPQFPAQGLDLLQEGDMRFRWSGPPDDGGRFRLQVARDGDFTNPVLDQVTQEHVVMVPMAPGVYHWRVREESGTPAGKWSPAVTFRIREPEPVR